MASLKLKSVTLDRVLPPNMDYEYLEHGALVPIQEDGEAFDLGTAWWLAECSLLAYEHPGFARMVFRLNGFEGFRFFKGISTECYVANDDTKAIVAFRGTEVKSLNAIGDIMRDVAFLPVPFHGLGNVHQGFAEALMEVWPSVEEHLARLRDANPTIAVFFTGHSLGAATATLAATLAKDIAALYTFGSPKVGDLRFAGNAPKKHYRVFNYGDPIVQLPPSLPLIKGFPGNEFAHCGDPWYIDSNHELRHSQGDQDSVGDVLQGLIANTGSQLRDKTYALWRGLKNRLMASRKREAKREGSMRLLLEGAYASFIQKAGADSHAPMYYAVHLWNNLVRERFTAVE